MKSTIDPFAAEEDRIQVETEGRETPRFLFAAEDTLDPQA